MPTSSWKASEKWLTSREVFEEWKELLEKGNVESVIAQLNDTLSSMENEKQFESETIVRDPINDQWIGYLSRVGPVCRFQYKEGGKLLYSIEKDIECETVTLITPKGQVSYRWVEEAFYHAVMVGSKVNQRNQEKVMHYFMEEY